MDSLEKRISKMCGLKEDDVATALQAFVDIVFDDVNKYGQCKLSGFGTFIKKESKPHFIRNIQTGKKSITKHTFRLGFKPCGAAKERLNRN